MGFGFFIRSCPFPVHVLAGQGAAVVFRCPINIHNAYHLLSAATTPSFVSGSFSSCLLSSLELAGRHRVPGGARAAAVRVARLAGGQEGGGGGAGGVCPRAARQPVRALKGEGLPPVDGLLCVGIGPARGGGAGGVCPPAARQPVRAQLPWLVGGTVGCAEKEREAFARQQLGNFVRSTGSPVRMRCFSCPAACARTRSLLFRRWRSAWCWTSRRSPPRSCNWRLQGLPAVQLASATSRHLLVAWHSAPSRPVRQWGEPGGWPAASGCWQLAQRARAVAPPSGCHRHAAAAPACLWAVRPPSLQLDSTPFVLPRQFAPFCALPLSFLLIVPCQRCRCNAK